MKGKVLYCFGGGHTKSVTQIIPVVERKFELYLVIRELSTN